MRSMTSPSFAIFVLSFSCLAETASAGLLIRGNEYFLSGNTETINAGFDIPDSAESTLQYRNFVLITVSGVGQSWATRLNDAFWTFTDAQGAPTAPEVGDPWHQLVADASPIVPPLPYPETPSDFRLQRLRAFPTASALMNRRSNSSGNCVPHRHLEAYSEANLHTVMRKLIWCPRYAMIWVRFD